jgi:hypothetical protein
MSDVTPFTHVDRSVARDIIGVVKKELSSVLEPYGLSMEMGSVTYSSDEGWVRLSKIRLAVSLDGEKPLTAQEQALKYELERREGREYELDPQKPGATIDGQECILVGYKPRATKRPFVIKMLETGTEYNIPVRMANLAFAALDEGSANV